MTKKSRTGADRELQILATIGRVLVETLDPTEFPGKALRELLSALDLGGGAIYLLKEEEFVLVAHHGLSPRFVQATARLPKDHHRLGPVVATRKPAVATDFQSPVAHEEGLGWVAYFPVVAREGPLGVLAVGRRDRRELGSSDMALLKVAAAQLGLALGQAMLHQETKELLERYRLLLDNDLVGIFVVQDGRLAYVNAGLCQMAGCTAEELLGRDPRVMVHPEDREQVGRNLLLHHQAQPLGGKIPNLFKIARLGHPRWKVIGRREWRPTPWRGLTGGRLCGIQDESRWPWQGGV